MLSIWVSPSIFGADRALELCSANGLKQILHSGILLSSKRLFFDTCGKASMNFSICWGIRRHADLGPGKCQNSTRMLSSSEISRLDLSSKVIVSPT